MKGSAAIIFLVVLGFVAALCMLTYIFLIKPQGTAISSSPNSTAAAQSASVKDFAPNLPMSQKTTIIIQTSDSSDIKYIVPTNQVDTYIKQLPSGYQVISKSP